MGVGVGAGVGITNVWKHLRVTSQTHPSLPKQCKYGKAAKTQEKLEKQKNSLFTPKYRAEQFAYNFFALGEVNMMSNGN